MRCLTVKQVKKIDQKATQQIGISTLVMMENAGIRIADFVLKILAKKKDKKIAVICGKGNNAGDGLVVSRQLICEDVDVDTFLLAPPDSLSTEAKRNLSILKRLTRKIYLIKTKEHLKRISFSSYSLLVDAIFGIGLKGKVEGIFKAAIEKINSSRGTVISVDVPSGLDANKGVPLGIAVNADYTISLIAPKKGFLSNRARRFTGRLITSHIGFPCQRI